MKKIIAAGLASGLVCLAFVSRNEPPKRATQEISLSGAWTGKFTQDRTDKTFVIIFNQATKDIMNGAWNWGNEGGQIAALQPGSPMRPL